MKRNYHSIRRDSKASETQLTKFLVKNGQPLLPMVQLIEQSQLMLGDLIEVLGRASIEAVLELSARELAGAPQQGRRRQGTILWHGAQPGRVYLRDRQLRVRRPRLPVAAAAAARRWRFLLTQPCRMMPG